MSAPGEEDAAALHEGEDKDEDETCVRQLKEQLIKALTLSQQAVCADTEGDRVTALTLYGESARQLEEIIPFVPPDHARVMAKYSGVYTQRVGELKEEVACVEAKDAQFVIPQFAVHFVEHPAPTGLVPTPPASTIRLPFWLMRLLSLTVQTGANLTPEVYVSREVWTQDGAHLFVKAVAPKTRYCEVMCDLLAVFQDIDIANSSSVSRLIDDFMTNAEVAFKSLQKEMPSDAGSQLQKEAQQPEVRQGSKTMATAQRAWSAFRSRMTDSGSRKAEPSVAYNSYLPWLVSLLEACQAIDNIAAVYTSSTSPPGAEPVLGRLHRLSAHLYYGVCAFVLKDLTTLQQRYMRKLRESYSRLFPAHFMSASKSF